MELPPPIEIGHIYSFGNWHLTVLIKFNSSLFQVAKAAFAKDEHVKYFGLEVKQQMAVVNARVLEPPMIQYSQKVIYCSSSSALHFISIFAQLHFAYVFEIVFLHFLLEPESHRNTTKWYVFFAKCLFIRFYCLFNFYFRQRVLLFIFGWLLLYAGSYWFRWIPIWIPILLALA